MARRAPSPPPRFRAFLANVARGVAIGASDLVPGVSGGTMALVLGIYPRLILAISELTRSGPRRSLAAGRVREAWLAIDGAFLASLAIGVAVAVLSLATALDLLLERHAELLYAAFFGMIVVSAWLVALQVPRRGRATAWALVGATGAFVVVGLAPTSTPDHPLAYVLAGAIGVSALLLPGLSGAFLLLLLGKYEQVLAAASTLDLSVLFPFAAGLAVGALAFARAIGTALRRWPSAVLGTLAGILVGSLRRVWPWQDADSLRAVALAPPSLADAGLALALAVVAGAAVVALHRASRGGDGSFRS